MSAKACNRCGGPIVFGKDEDTGRIIPLSVGARVYRMVRENIVTLDSKAFVPHVCLTGRELEPPPDRDFTEPKSNELDV